MNDTLHEWATAWGVPPEAIYDLQQRLLPQVSSVPTDTPASEAKVQQEIRLEASRKGLRLWRNNNGACTDQNGRLIRYGLANDSAKVNRNIKSSDLIGITPVQVGFKTYGVFTSIEVKKEGWTYKGTDRERAQLAWITLVTAMGGIAKFATSKEDI